MIFVMGDIFYVNESMIPPHIGLCRCNGRCRWGKKQPTKRLMFSHFSQLQSEKKKRKRCIMSCGGPKSFYFSYHSVHRSLPPAVCTNWNPVRERLSACHRRHKQHQQHQHQPLNSQLAYDCLEQIYSSACRTTRRRFLTILTVHWRERTVQTNNEESVTSEFKRTTHSVLNVSRTKLTRKPRCGSQRWNMRSDLWPVTQSTYLEWDGISVGISTSCQAMTEFCCVFNACFRAE